MSNLRDQFEVQCQSAKITAEYKKITLDVVMVRHKGYATRISIIGNAISRAAYQNWRADGSQVRLLRVFDGVEKI